MNVAIVHDILDEFGGAERVLLSLLELFPDATVFTSFYTDDTPLLIRTLSHIPVHTLPASLLPLSDHTSLFQAAAPVLWRTLPLRGYDLVISAPSHLMCNLIHTTATHIQYIHRPPKNVFGLSEKTPLQRVISYDAFLTRAYQRAIQSTPHLVTNSRHMQNIFFSHFHRRPDVIYPPVDMPDTAPKHHKGDYYLTIGRIDSQKHLELSVAACTKLHLPYRIVGKTNEPRYEAHLKRIAGPTVSFSGFVSDKETAMLYKHAKAFLFPSKDEDFGIAPVEAMAHGVPVIAYYGGGAKETVIEGKTGTFFHAHTIAALTHKLQIFNPNLYTSSALYRHAKKFEKRVFKQQFHAYAQQVMKNERIS